MFVYRTSKDKEIAMQQGLLVAKRLADTDRPKSPHHGRAITGGFVGGGNAAATVEYFTNDTDLALTRAAQGAGCQACGNCKHRCKS